MIIAVIPTLEEQIPRMEVAFNEVKLFLEQVPVVVMDTGAATDGSLFIITRYTCDHQVSLAHLRSRVVV